MNKPEEYCNATAFRMVIEAWLKNMADIQEVDVQRLRRQVAFDRLLCRLFHRPSTHWILKGGYAMELRMEVARTTRDIDLSLQDLPALRTRRPANEVILDLLQEAVATDLHDYFAFLVGEPLMDLEGAPDGGARYPVEARMDGRTFARFHLDVGLGDETLEPLDTVQSKDWLGFADIPPGMFRIISKEQQFAEKYHAYTRPWADRPNSRVRDLVDMTLLIQTGELDPARIVEALRITFRERTTHDLPEEVPHPPDNWTGPFEAMATECQMDTDIRSAVVLLSAFVGSLKAK